MKEFAKEYTSIDARLRGLDPIEDRSTVRQLIAAKGEILKAWRAACRNSYEIKAAKQQVILDINAADMRPEAVEAAKVDIELLTRASKGQKIMAEDRDKVLAEVRKGGAK